MIRWPAWKVVFVTCSSLVVIAACAAPAPTATATLEPAATALPSPTTTATATPTATPTPLPESVLLEPMNYQRQTFNNCGPASVAIL